MVDIYDHHSEYMFLKGLNDENVYVKIMLSTGIHVCIVTLTLLQCRKQIKEGEY